MRGTLRKKGERWYYQFPVVQNGKRRQVSKGGFRTKREAQVALTDALAAHSQGTHVEPSKLTLREYLVDEWLPLQMASKKPSTYTGYSAIVDRVLPFLGDTKLSELSAGDIAGLYATLRVSGRRNGARAGLSAQSIKHTHSVIHSSLEHAVAAGLLPRNPARSIPKDARPRPRKTEMRTWSAEQLRAFLATAENDRYRAAYLLAGTGGLRRSELLGLRWEDVDLDRSGVSVRRGLVAAGYTVHEGEPKSGRARTVRIPGETAAELRRHRARQLQERMAWGEAWQDTGLVFTREDGTSVHPQSLSGAFERAVKRSGVPVIRFHDLRHTCASLLLLAGIHPKVVQEMLGHASISITLDLYSHVAPGMQEEAAARLGSIVFGGS